MSTLNNYKIINNASKLHITLKKDITALNKFGKTLKKKLQFNLF